MAARRAIVPQSTTLSFPFTVLEVVKLGASVPGFDQHPAHSRRLADDALSDVALEDFRDRLYAELSGGERQRVHIARALCQLSSAPRQRQQTAVLLLDEPTSSLDLSHQSLVLAEVREQARDGLAVAVVLHDLNLAAAWADEVVLMSKGRIAARGVPAAIFKDDLLSDVFGCTIEANKTPPAGVPYMLPHLLRPATIYCKTGNPTRKLLGGPSYGICLAQVGAPAAARDRQDDTMRLTKTTSHAIRILIDCAQAPDKLVKVAAIAERLDITQLNVFKVVHLLSRAGFITAVRGRNGGVRLAGPAAAIRIGDVVRATEVTRVEVESETDGARRPKRSGRQLNTIFDEALEAFISVLDRHTLEDMAQGRAAPPHIGHAHAAQEAARPCSGSARGSQAA